MYLLRRDDNSSECNDKDELAAKMEDLGGAMPSTTEGIRVTGCY